MEMVDKDIVQIKAELNSLTTKLLKAYQDSVTRYSEEKIKNGKDLEEQNNVNSSLVHLVEDHEKQICELNDIIESKECDIAELQTELEKLRGEMVEIKKEKSNSERHDMLKAQANEIVAKSNEIDRLNKLLAKKDKKTNVEMVVKEDVEKKKEEPISGESKLTRSKSEEELLLTGEPVITPSSSDNDEPNNKTNDKTESLSDKELSESEEEELSIIKYRKKEYYIDTSDPPNVYEILDDDEMGDKIGTWQETQGKNGKMKYVVVRD
tara:strand:- start:12081 stop:12878 length:798 start_codon:yes stop_codon:yes gene_type:complete